MSYPLVIVTGQAGSGKDTVAAFAAEYMHGQCIAQADPMKRLARYLFGFTEEQLWGPSSARNAKDPNWTPEKIFGFAGKTIGGGFTMDWLKEVLPGLDGPKLQAAFTALDYWNQDVLRECAKRGEVTARYVLQTLGTEWGRKFSKNMWVDCAITTAKKLLGGGHSYTRTEGLRAEEGREPQVVIITDGRFRNELLAVKELGGKVVRVANPSASAKDALETARAGVAGHASEKEMAGIPEEFMDVVFLNDKSKGLEACQRATQSLCRQHLIASPEYHTFDLRDLA